jgi:subtilisin family serine protease
MLPTTHSLRGSNKLRARKANLSIETLEDRQLLSASPAYPIAPTDILIQLKAGAATPVGSQVLAGTTVGPEIALVPGLHEVTLAPGVSVARALTAYRNSPAVQEAESDAVVHESAAPNDAYYQEDQWALNNTGQTGGTYGDSIQAEAAWNVTTGSKNVIVATLDSGVDYTDTDLAANIWTNPDVNPTTGVDSANDGYTDDIHGWNFVSNNNNVMDDFWHGTHVAGIIGAVGDNGVGVTGVNWNVQIMALKMLDSSGNGTTANAVLALDYAVEHGAKVVNISWNGGAYSQAFHDAIQNAGNLGVLVVCAAGNNNANDDATTNYPPSYNLPRPTITTTWPPSPVTAPTPSISPPQASTS